MQLSDLFVWDYMKGDPRSWALSINGLPGACVNWISHKDRNLFLAKLAELEACAAPRVADSLDGGQSVSVDAAHDAAVLVVGEAVRLERTRIKRIVNRESNQWGPDVQEAFDDIIKAIDHEPD